MNNYCYPGTEVLINKFNTCEKLNSTLLILSENDLEI